MNILLILNPKQQLLGGKLTLSQLNPGSLGWKRVLQIICSSLLLKESLWLSLPGP